MSNPEERTDEQSTTAPRSFASRVHRPVVQPGDHRRYCLACEVLWPCDAARARTAELRLSNAQRVEEAVAELKAAVLAGADHELVRVDHALRDAGIEYPLGARGVADLGGLFRGALDVAEETERETVARARRQCIEELLTEAARLLAKERPNGHDITLAGDYRSAAKFLETGQPT